MVKTVVAARIWDSPDTVSRASMTEDNELGSISVDAGRSTSALFMTRPEMLKLWCALGEVLGVGQMELEGV